MAVYLDHNATTPLDPRIRAALEPWAGQRFGNSSSRDHRWGWDAAEAVEAARAQVAEALNAPVDGVTFTSGATEALNTVIRGYVGFDGWAGKKIVTCATEHEAVLAPCRYLCERTCVALEILPVDEAGRVDLDRLRASLAGAPGALVALMAANNETGTLHPLREIADVVHAAEGIFLSDTTQAVGKLPLDLRAAGADFATVSAHKVYGPKGVGALMDCSGARRGPIEPLILGGGQERGVRGGTLNVPGIVGLGEACRLVQECLDEDIQRMQTLRDRLEHGILSRVDETWVNGDPSSRLCNTSNVGFRGVDARVLIRDMHDVAVSTRSACSSGHSGPSHVLKAMGLSDDDAYSCVRFSLGRFTTEDEIDYAIEKVVISARKLRASRSGGA
ncbi:MAG TPA: cysteine desulfurase family protein [Longimicrobium sp.]|jgi:cysteine desulfurase